MAALWGPGQDQGPTLWSIVWMQRSRPEGKKKKKRNIKFLIKRKKPKTNNQTTKTNPTIIKHPKPNCDSNFEVKVVPPFCICVEHQQHAYVLASPQYIW